MRGNKCHINHIMDVATCKQMIQHAREDAIRNGELHKRFKNIVGLVYAVFLDEGCYNIEPVDAEKFSDVPRTTLKEYILVNEWV